MTDKNKRKELLLDAAHVTGGAILYTVANYCFTTPNEIAPGGVAGLATMLHTLTQIPLGFWTVMLNLPLLLLSWKIVGRKFTLKTVFTIAVLYFFYDVVLVHFPVYHGEPLLAALYGGVLMGAGLGLVFMRDFTTGGSDVVAKIVQVYRPHLQMGQVILAFDTAVILTSGLVFGKIESVMYAGITIFAYTKVIDLLLYKGNTGKVVFVISRKGAAIARRIILECHRGVTILNGRGAYTNMGMDVLVVAMRSRDYFQLKTIAEEEDERAFIIASDCGEIRGNGFRPGDPKEKPAADWNGIPERTETAKKAEE
ncbi:MAG: YitT family protein [Oscillospiraceae bacterium]|nr:YitT family protein [Oscillospiraceae bacterium]